MTHDIVASSLSLLEHGPAPGGVGEAVDAIARVVASPAEQPSAGEFSDDVAELLPAVAAGTTATSASVVFRSGARGRLTAVLGEGATSAVGELLGAGGPAVAALDTGAVVCIPDLASDPHWRTLWAGVRRLPAAPRAAISVGLALPYGHQAALTLCFAEPLADADADADADAAADAARVAGGLLGIGLTAVLHRRKADNLVIALDTNRQIGAALGILIVQNRCTYDDAFEALKKCSQRTHRRLRDVAAEVLYSGALPSG